MFVYLVRWGIKKKTELHTAPVKHFDIVYAYDDDDDDDEKQYCFYLIVSVIILLLYCKYCSLSGSIS